MGPSEVEDINRKPQTLLAGTSPSAFSLWPSSKLPNPQPDQLLLPRKNAPETPMSSANTLPGRPGNLTAEEEAKLKELWLVTLKVFGVSSPAGSEPTSPPPATLVVVEDPDSAISATPLSPDQRKKNRKSFGRFLGRKSRPEKEAEKKESPVQELVVNVNTTDDKYGHTADFKAALASQTPAELREAFWGMVKCDNPDGLLLRFLRARKWDVDKALVMMVATMNWRSNELNVCPEPQPVMYRNPILTKSPHRCKALLKRARAAMLRTKTRVLSSSFGWARASCTAVIRRDGRYVLSECVSTNRLTRARRLWNGTLFILWRPPD